MSAAADESSPATQPATPDLTSSGDGHSNGHNSRLSIKPFLISNHIKDKGILCTHFLNDSWCPVVNCPYAHVAAGTRRPIPQSVCQQWFKGRCSRDDCGFFHGTQDKLDKLRDAGVNDYCITDDLPVRDAAEHADDPAALPSSATVCGVVRTKMTPPQKATSTGLVPSGTATSHHAKSHLPPPPPYSATPAAVGVQPPMMMMVPAQPMMYAPQPMMYAPAQAGQAQAPMMMAGAGGQPMMMMAQAPPPGYVMMMPATAASAAPMAFAQQPMAFAQYPMPAMMAPMSFMPAPPQTR